MQPTMDRVAADYLDLCTADVEAIVNPAHRDLLGGGGLDGAIHDAAGPELLEACRLLRGCEPGDAKTTPGFRLQARWVIHSVGPMWRGGGAEEAQVLARCYQRSLQEAVLVQAETLAIPGISTGLHRFPVELAAAIAVREVLAFLGTSASPRSVLFACFDHHSLAVYRDLLERAL